MHNYYRTLTTKEGNVIQGFEKLYKIYGEKLPERLESLAISMNMKTILTDNSMYRRFLDLYNRH